MSLAIETVDKNDATVIKLKGALTLGPCCTHLNQVIHSLIDAGRRHLVFDMAEVSQLDSTGIGQFIDAYTTLEKVKGQVKGKMSLAGASGTVLEAFRVTRLDTVFEFAPSVEAALGS